MSYFEKQKDPLARLNDYVSTLRNIKSLNQPGTREINTQNRHTNLANEFSKDLASANDNDQLQAVYSNFSDYYNRNLDNMDENTHEIFNFLKNDFIDKFERNSSFVFDRESLMNMKDDVLKIVNDWDNAFGTENILASQQGDGDGYFDIIKPSLDGSNELYTKQLKAMDYQYDGGEITQENNPDLYAQYESDLVIYDNNIEKAQGLFYDNQLNKLRRFSDEFVNFKHNFYDKYADRITRGGSHYYLQDEFDNQSQMLSFIWGAATNDGRLDAAERDAFMHYIETGNNDRIDEYYKNTERHLYASQQNLIANMNEQMVRLEELQAAKDGWNNSKNNIGSEGGTYIDSFGNQKILKWDSTDNANNEAILSNDINYINKEIKRLRKNILNSDKSYFNLVGQSHLNTVKFNNTSLNEWLDISKGGIYGFQTPSIIVNADGTSSNISANENLNNLRNIARNKGEQSFQTSDGIIHTTKLPSENNDEWLQVLDSNKKAVINNQRVDATNYDLNPNEFDLPDSSIVVENHLRISQSENKDLWNRAKKGKKVTKSQSSEAMGDYDTTSVVYDKHLKKQVQDTVTKPKLDDVLAAFLPGMYDFEQIKNNMPFGTDLNYAFEQGSFINNIKVADDKSWNQMKDWIWDIFVSTHQGTIGAPNKKLYNNFTTNLKKYIGYLKNPEYGSDHSKTQKAYTALKKIYEKMSIGINDNNVKGNYSK